MRDLEQIYAIPETERTPEQAATITASEAARWGASFDAWRLGRRALSAAGAEAEALWDEMMAAFEAISSTPVDPGNDEGPFWAVAHAMDERRVRQAMAIVARMASTPGWTYRLNGSRAALAGRLAMLGCIDEAVLWTERLDPLDDFCDHWRSILWGSIVGAQRAREPEAWELNLPEGLDLLQVFLQMERVGGPSPSDAAREAWRRLAANVVEDERRLLLQGWIEEWGEVECL